jgi:nucleoside-diphosphate-sugar epimerase
MPRVFLTGSTGFIGSHLFKKLMELDYQVDTHLRLLDYRKYDCVIHLAAVTHIRTEFDPAMYEANVVFAQKILSTPFRTIYASSCSAKYLTNPYAYTKRYCEWLGDRHGNALGLRLHNVYGSGNNKGIVHHLMNQENGATIEVKGANLIRDYIHIDDVVDYVIAHGMRKHVSELYPGGFYMNGIRDVGTGTGTRTIDLVQKFEEVSGKTFTIKTNEDWGGGNEPVAMVSNNPILSVSFKEGLLKTINNGE